MNLPPFWKNELILMWGQAKDQACADLGAMTPISAVPAEFFCCSFLLVGSFLCQYCYRISGQHVLATPKGRAHNSLRQKIVSNGGPHSPTPLCAPLTQSSHWDELKFSPPVFKVTFKVLHQLLRRHTQTNESFLNIPLVYILQAIPARGGEKIGTFLFTKKISF